MYDAAAMVMLMFLIYLNWPNLTHSICGCARVIKAPSQNPDFERGSMGVIFSICEIADDGKDLMIEHGCMCNTRR